MQRLFARIFFAFGVILIARAQSKVVCYWQGIIAADEINPKICSHIIYAFVGVHETGELFFLAPDASQKLSSLMRIKQQNEELITMVAIGGANDDLSKAFSIMANSAAYRRKFTENVVKLLTLHSLSGVDIDWEYPTTSDKGNFLRLLQELKTALDSLKLILSIAAAPDKWRAQDFYDIPQISETVDFINLMTYDFHGSWDTTVGHHAQMFPHRQDSSYAKELNCAASLNYWLTQGAPAHKLVLGIPTYGNIYVLSNVKQHLIGSLVNVNATRNSPGTLGYDRYCATKSSGWKKQFDSNYRSIYAINDQFWFGFDSVNVFMTKARFAKTKGLGGVMVWSLDTDDRQNGCKHGTFPLISSAFNELSKK